jgi:hypothetical protein
MERRSRRVGPLRGQTESCAPIRANRAPSVRRGCLVLIAAVAAVFGPRAANASGARPSDAAAAASPASVVDSFGALPMRFERNEGQTDPRVSFLSRGRGYALFLTPGEVVLSLARARERSVVRMRLVGGRATPQIAGEILLPGRSHSYVGSDPAKWWTDVKQYGRVAYRGVWEGIDVAFYGTQLGEIEADFVVAPGADPRAIRLAFDGARRVRLDAEGNLVVETSTGEVVQRRPVVYQDVGGVRRTVAGSWALKGRKQAVFRVASWDRSATLVIDPVLVYSSCLGGSAADVGRAIAVDAAGNAYVTGQTSSIDFPTEGPPFQANLAGSDDVFVAKVDPASGIVYSTYLGGRQGRGYDLLATDDGLGIAVDAAGNASVAGRTSSLDFPVTTGAAPSRPGAGALVTNHVCSGAQYDNAFIAKLGPGGALLASRVLGWAGGASGIALDGAGNTYLTGYERGLVAMGLCYDTYRAVVHKMNASLDTVYTTSFGDADTYKTSGRSVATDAAGNAWVIGTTDAVGLPTTGPPFQAALGGGSDAFLAEVGPTGSLLYLSYLGGAANDAGAGIAVDAGGSVYVSGETSSVDFPTAGSPLQAANAGSRDAFVAKLSPASGLVYSTYLGGTGDDIGRGLVLDASGNVCLTGQTTSAGFPTAGSPIQPSLAGQNDAFVATLSPAAGLIESTFLGGSADDEGVGIAIDPAGGLYLTGHTASSNFYTVGTPFQSVNGGAGDAFVVKIRGRGTTFFTLDPCRLADTRSASGASGGPALAANTKRSFPVAGLCGVPSTATAVALNVTVTDETDFGDLRLYPAGGRAPDASTINFVANKPRANSAVTALGLGGQIGVACDMLPGSTGQTHLVVDVTGYYR